jgi:hypothetical protein
MRLVHGGLALDLPAGWSDQSTLLFTAPVDDVALPTTRKTQRTTESVAVTFALADDKDADAIVRDEVEQLKAADPGLVLVEVAPFSCALGDGRLATVKLTLGETPLRQLTLAVLVGPIVVRATASCLEAAFAKREAGLRSILQSIGLSSSSSSPAPKVSP